MIGARPLRWLTAAIILLIAAFLALQIWTMRLGLHRYRAGDVNGALPLLKVAHILNPFTDSIDMALADIDIQKGEIEKAEEILRKLISHNPDNARAHNLLGVAFQTQNQIAEAMVEYNLAIQLDPRFALAHFNRGYLLLRANKVKEGMESLAKAIELEPALSVNREEVIQRLPPLSPVLPERAGSKDKKKKSQLSHK